MTTTNKGKHVDYQIAFTQAVNILDKYANLDPKTAKEWKDPDQVFRLLLEAKDNLMKARQQDLSSQEDSSPGIDETSCQAMYMDMITASFADVLENLRKDELSKKELDMSVLADCLQSGLEFLSTEEREMFMIENNEDEMDEASLTGAQEEIRHRLGLDLTIDSQ